MSSILSSKETFIKILLISQSDMKIKVGTCGFSAKGGRKRYYEYFKVVEIQDTFYRLIKPKTAIRWRNQAPEGFEFAIKAWQGITHPTSSPTWRKANVKVSSEKRDKYGFFKPTEEVFKAWEYVKKIAEILKAKVIIFQTPPSFRCTEENIRNMRFFFENIDRGSLLLGWEPRGTWYNHQEVLKEILDKLDIIHVVDPLRHSPLRIPGTAYFRLHGLGGREVNYRYKYTESDLKYLKSIILSLENVDEVYVMFNNVYMFDDALYFKKILQQKN